MKWTNKNKDGKDDRYRKYERDKKKYFFFIVIVVVQI